MDNFLAKFKPEKKMNVGVSVSPTAGLEMIVVDAVTRKIEKYAMRSLAYNTSSREIEDYSEFKLLLTELFNELKIDARSANIVLNMPSVQFGHTYLPTTLDDESVTVALKSETEQSYLFKKNEPVVSWQEVKANNTTEKRYILYSAMQQEVVDKISQIFSELGATLIAIENTYSSLMKTLEYTGVAKDFARTSRSWNILLVSQNSYAVFSLSGFNIIDYYEDPLAIKSFNGDEVYVAISQAASSVLERFPSDNLMIISESSDVSAEILAIQLKHPGDVTFLECNQYANESIMPVDLNVLPHYVKNITPEAIGAAIYRAMDFSITMNFCQENAIQDTTLINFMGMSVNKEQLLVYSVLITLVIAGIGYAGQLAINKYVSKLNDNIQSITSEQNQVNAQIESLQKESDKQDIYTLVKKVEKGMVEKILYYNAIGSNIPAKTWITSFYADSRGAYGIEGQTVSVDDVYLFYRNVKSQVEDSDLIVSKLSVDDKNGMIDIETTPNANYSFALSNAKYTPEKVADPSQAAAGAPGNMEVPNLPNLPN